MIVGMNGACIEEDKAVVSVLDHGFLYGIGLFETFRTYGGVPFLFDRHMDRLAEGCSELAIRYGPDRSSLLLHVRELLAANGFADGYVRLSVSAGIQPLGLPASDYADPNIIVYVKPLPPASPPEGKPLQLLKLRRNSPEGLIRTKSFHYMNNVLAKREMAAYPWSNGAEGLFLDGNGYVAEGIVSNLFFVVGGQLYTPSLDTGILPGITRAHVLELAEEAGIPYSEGRYPVEQLYLAEEIFLTNSVQELVPVHTIYDEYGGKAWQRKNKAITEILQRAYGQSVAAYCR